ncbi:MAG: DUF5320 domain-containing protein [Candidatus Bathyarchaeia archaeon]|nr:DUF5320 domain-containing protein [Candidatus Bathyarchaeia archaeon]
MPWGDRTGPWGLGPMTGRAAGYCAGYPVPGYMNPMPGFGWGFGFGRGWGRGFGRGFRRWLWAYPWYRYQPPYTAYGPGYWYPWSAYPTPRYPYPPTAYQYWYPSAPYMAYW